MISLYCQSICSDSFQSASCLCLFVLVTRGQFIWNKRLLFSPTAVIGCMQAHCSRWTQGFSLCGGKWKWLEHWQQLIRCFHGRALTTKSKQRSFGTTETKKYWKYKTTSTLGVAFFQYQNNGKRQVFWHITVQWEITGGLRTNNFLKCFHTSSLTKKSSTS